MNYFTLPLTAFAIAAISTTTGLAQDCNGNGILDVNELNSTTDANSNGVLDECETTRQVPSAMYPTIADALAVANNGDTISIGAGVYGGAGNRELDIRDITLQFVGSGPFQTTIDLEDSGRFALFVDQDSRHDMKILIENIRFLDGNSLSSTLFLGEGGAIKNFRSDLRLQRCIFESNVAGNGGALALDNRDSLMEAVNCLFFDNEALVNGGAIYAESYGEPVVRNTTIVDNTAISGSALYNAEGSFSVLSSILRSNPTSGLAINLNSTIPSTIAYSNLPGAELSSWQTQTGQMGSNFGNIAANVKWVNRPANDYHIRSNSPCRNAGTLTPSSLEPDIDGNSRIIDGRIDMGCDEVLGAMSR